MSAKILQFVPRTRQLERRASKLRSMFRSAPRCDDLVMDHADTAPCECVGQLEEWQGGEEPA